MVSEYLQFQNPEFVAVVIGLLLFIIATVVLRKMNLGGGIVFVAALAISIMSSWYLFKSGMIYEVQSLPVVILLLVIGLLVVLFLPFGRFLRRNF